MVTILDLPDRLADRLVPVVESGCWIWTGSIQQNGYGRVAIKRQVRPVHRVTYELLVGSIPEGLDLDHVRRRGCLARCCANPAHLEPVTRSENNRRGRGGQRWSHCKRGHVMDDANTYITPGTGHRACYTCIREQELRRGKRKNRTW